MSTIVACSLDSQVLYLFGDTIETFENAIPPNRQFFSSHGERIGILPTKEGFLTYAESACKIGQFGRNGAIGAAGNRGFIESVLDIIYCHPLECSSEADVLRHFLSAAESLSPSPQEPGSEAQFLINLTDLSGRLFCVYATLTVRPDGVVQVKTGECKFETAGFLQAHTFGIGAQYIQGVPQDLLVSSREPGFKGLASPMLALAFSSQLRKATSAQTLSVGGALLSVELTSQGMAYMRDTIFMHADQSGEIQYFSKVINRGDIFLITDYIERRATVLRSLDGESKARRNPSVKIDISRECLDALTFNCDLFLFDHRSSLAPHSPNILVFEDPNGTTLKGFPPDLNYLPNDGVLEINVGQEKITLRVRR